MQIKSKYDPDDSLSSQAWANASIKHTLDIFPSKNMVLISVLYNSAILGCHKFDAYVSVWLLS